MATARIYAPLSGYITNMDNGVCNPHSACDGGSKPTDIGANANASLYLYSNGEIRSFYVVHDDSCAPGCDPPYSDVVKIHLYNKLNYSCEIGWILFGHVKNRMAAGGYNYAPSGVKIGNVPNDDGSCDYYDGEHSHMEAKAYSGVSLSRGSYQCNTYVTKGSTTIYKWSFTPSSYCP